MKKIVIFVFLLSLTFFLSNSTLVLANGEEACPGGVCKLDNPLGSVESPQALIGIVINSVLSVVGSIALLMFVYGGLVWMTSVGNAEKIKTGRDIILWSAVGLVVIFSAYALTRLVLNTIVK